MEAKSGHERELAQLSKMESFTKRRSTMNSRAAYDEDEVLRKVIEESKGEGHAISTDGSTRKGKRSREDSEEYVLIAVDNRSTKADVSLS